MQKWETAESNLVNEEEANLENRRPEFEQGPLDAMDAFVAALNARDDEALYHTITYPTSAFPLMESLFIPLWMS